ncbi:hypothetical protein [Moraxella oblonga]|uniref:hypothetical protein n=1 Tax=Moraxella oblonga TaxID=200413 RepID=UPI00082C8741|nr:hypothetical protein [Moraxella oblonga]
MQTISFEVNDNEYQDFVKKIGTDNLALYFKNFISEFSRNDEIYPPAYHRLGGVVPFKIPENFDDEMTDFSQ